MAYEFPEVLGKPPASWEKLDELLCKITPCGEPPVYAYVREVTYDHNTRRLHFGDEFIDLSATRAEPIGRARFRRMIKNTIELVRNGDPLPEEFSQELVSYKKPPVLRLSDNVDPTNLQQAIELGNQTFFARPVVILDGLPHGDKNGKVTGGELKLMGLKRSQRAGWQDLRKSIAERKMPITKASAERVKEQLLRGHENILFLIAHNDGKHIYLPSGERLSMEELSLLKRDTSPDRVIVLVTCYGLRSSEGLEKSLAKTFVQNRFAKTVFATHETFDARSVPGLLDRLRTNNTPLREILQEYGLQQIVKLLRGGEANVLA